jgi:hypothetical protein
MKTLRLLVVPICLWVVLASLPRQALADEYDDSQSHPLRVVAYLAYPSGFLLEWLVFRPFHVLVSGTPELESFFGHRDHPPLFTDPLPSYEFGASKRVAIGEKAAPRRAAPQMPIAERVTLKEVPVEKAVLKEVTSP